MVKRRRDLLGEQRPQEIKTQQKGYNLTVEMLKCTYSHTLLWLEELELLKLCFNISFEGEFALK